MWPDYIAKPVSGKSYPDPIVIDGDCWRWNWNRSQRCPTYRDHGRPVSARRFVYEAERGPLPGGVKRLIAGCGNTYCVNPEHTQFRETQCPGSYELTYFNPTDRYLTDVLARKIEAGKALTGLERELLDRLRIKIRNSAADSDYIPDLSALELIGV